MLNERQRRHVVFMLVLVISCALMFSADTDFIFAKSKPKLKKITINPKSVTMTVGDKKSLKVKFSPKKAKRKVIWKSSNKKIATVKKGVITAKKAGTVTITAKAGKRKARCKVKVKSVSQNYINTTSAYTYLNEFRTKSNAWQWNEDNVTKTYFNTGEGNDLSPLKRDVGLEKTAQTRAKELVKSFSHNRPDGTSCFTAYPKDLRAMGENIAYGYTNTRTVTDAWIEEDDDYSGQGHRRNMLQKSFNVVGIAGYKYKGVIYWVQCFGKR